VTLGSDLPLELLLTQQLQGLSLFGVGLDMARKPKSKRKLPPKTLQEFLAASDTPARMKQLVDALTEHVFNVKVYGQEWWVYRFTLFGEKGTCGSTRWTSDKKLHLQVTAWAGSLSKTEVARRIRAAAVVDPALG
jgi:hypothetical protein